MTLLSIFEDN